MRLIFLACVFLVGCGNDEAPAPSIVSMATPVIVQSNAAAEKGALTVHVVTGSGNLLNAVVSALARNQIVAADLRVEQANLDDAFVALTSAAADDASVR